MPSQTSKVNSLLWAQAPAGAPKRLSLRKNFVWTVCGNVSYALCQWGMLVLLAKLGSVELVGTFVLALAIASPTTLFAGLQLRSALSTDSTGEYRFAEYWTLRLGSAAIAWCVILGIAFFAGSSAQSASVILLVGLAKCFELVSDILHGLLQQQERMDGIALSMLCKGVASLALIALAFRLTGSLVWVAAALALVWGVMLLAIDIPLARSALGNRSPVTLEFDAKRHWRLAKQALPLAYFALLSSLAVNIPRYFVESYLGTRELGAFAAITYLLSNLYFLQVALGSATMPRLARLYSERNRRSFLKLSGIVLGNGLSLSLLALIVSVFCGAWVLRIAYTAEYSDYADIFRWLAFGSLFQCFGAALAFLLNTMRHFKDAAIISSISTAILVAASAVLIPTFGLRGAAWALIISWIVSAVVSSYQFLYRLKELNNPYDSRT